MNRELFISQIRSEVPVGSVFENPGGGISAVLSVTGTHIAYRRGKSKISISFDDLFTAYTSFHGQLVCTSDLRVFAPSVFDSCARPSGHSCNATFLFSLLQRIRLAGAIIGSGVKGNPFSVHFFSPLK